LIAPSTAQPAFGRQIRCDPKTVVRPREAKTFYGGANGWAAKPKLDWTVATMIFDALSTAPISGIQPRARADRGQTSAAARRDIPSSTALTTLVRKSSDSGLAMRAGLLVQHAV
jgi:hypothetical protein